MNGDSTKERRFVEAMTALRERRPGDAAALRRSLGLSPGEDPRTHPVIYPWLDGVERADEWRWFLVAALVALVPSVRALPESRISLGSTARLLMEATRRPGDDKDRMSSVERRFVALLDAARSELPTHLRHFVRLAVTAGVPVDFATLLEDLRWWPRREVQRRWARDLWVGRREEERSATTTEGEDR